MKAISRSTPIVIQIPRGYGMTQCSATGADWVENLVELRSNGLSAMGKVDARAGGPRPGTEPPSSIDWAKT